MKKNRFSFVFFSLVLISCISHNVICQSISRNSSTSYMRLSGPRLGMTFITGESADRLKDEYDAVPFVSQFGWQFETRFFTLDNGTVGCLEGIALIGGLEQGLFLPSVNGLVGIRNARGLEFGVGPNVSLAGFALAVGGGFTISAGEVNFPVNIAVVPSNKGIRFSALFGFNAAKR